MNTPFFFEFWDQSHSLRGILLVITIICFLWALVYSKFNRKIRLALKGVILLTIAICLLIIITGGISPNNSNPLATLGIAIVCLSLMPKPVEKGRGND